MSDLAMIRTRHSTPTRPEGPRPLTREIVDQEPYPIEALGQIRPAVLAISDHTRAPVEICAQAVLGALALVLQAHADVVLPTGAARPLSMFLLTVAGSGERKSAVDALALKPVAEKEKLLRSEYQSAVATFEIDHALWEAQRAGALGDLKKPSMALSGEADLRALGEAPERPLTPMLVCPEPTFEGYCRLTATGLPALGIYSAEGGAFIGGFGMSADHRLKTAAGLSSLWDGDPVKRVRAGDGASILAGRRLSMHLMAQPDVAWQMINDEMLISQGLMSRILVSAPPSAAGTRFFTKPSPAAEANLARYHEDLAALLAATLPLARDTQNELQPRKLPLSDGAEQIWINLHDFIEERLVVDGEFHAIAGLANKAAEHAARLAGIMQLWVDFDAEEIGAAMMADASVIIQYYLTEALRLRDLAAVSTHLKLTSRVLDWLLDKWLEPAIHAAAIYNDCPIKAARDRKVALRIIATLVEHGWLAPISGGAIVKDVRRREAWLIHGRTLA